MNGGISSSATNKIEEYKPESKAEPKKVKKEVDKHLILCNVRSQNLDKEIEKYLAGVKEAYPLTNQINLVGYTDSAQKLSFLAIFHPSSHSR